MLQHIIDAERIFGYRPYVLQKRKPVAAGFDENGLCCQLRSRQQNMAKSADEFLALRRTTEILFETLLKKHYKRAAWPITNLLLSSVWALLLSALLSPQEGCGGKISLMISNIVILNI